MDGGDFNEKYCEAARPPFTFASDKVMVPLAVALVLMGWVACISFAFLAFHGRP